MIERELIYVGLVIVIVLAIVGWCLWTEARR